MTAHGNNFLVVEAAIVERLRAVLNDQQPAVRVMTAAELKDTQEQGQHAPAVHVIYGGPACVESRADARQARLVHTWMLVHVVRHARPELARQLAGELLARAGGAVMGLRVAGAAGPLRLAPRSPAPRHAGTTMFFPLVFEIETHFQALA